jgi:flagellar hook protein FlgE
MLGSLSSAVSGLDAYQQKMDVIGNNIANLETTGFKASRSDFGEAFSDTLQAATAATANTDGTNAMQVGTGVTTMAISNNWAAGAINSTGVTSDLAISGNGFFLVTDPVSGTQYATQDGTFSLNSQGYLVNATGQQVQGYSDTGLSVLGSIQINAAGAPSTSSPTATMVSYGINAQGVITVNLSDGTSFTRGQVLLQNFTDPQSLVSAGNNLYTNMSAAGGLSASAAPGTNGLGTIQSGALELSNVDLSLEMTNLITAQSAFEANSKIVTTSDTILQDTVNMKQQ